MFKPEFIHRVLRFAVVGVVVTGSFMALNWWFSAAWRVPPDLAYLAAYPVAVGLHFILNKWWTFSDRGGVRAGQVSEYLAMMLVAFLIQTAVFKLLTHFTPVPAWLASGLASVAQMALSFLYMQRRVFNRGVAGPAGFSWETRWTILTAGLIVWLYGYFGTSREATPFPLDREPLGYYELLVQAFEHGQLSLLVEPDPKLATLPDPYDPLARVKIGAPGMADMSYFRGRYYMYFGVGPAVALMLPFKLLTGYHLPSAALCALLCAGGFLLSTWIFADFRRRYFPATTGALWLGTVMLGMANLCLMMLTRSDFYEVPIAGAFFFSFAALAGLVLALRNGRSGHWWLVLASLAFGLAVASRPHFILGGGMAGLAWWWRREVRGPGRTPAWRDAAALVIPGALCIGGLLLYNYLRFGSPLNFGQIYQLGGSNQPKMKLVTAESVPVNLYYYLLAPARFGRYFPFVEIVPGYPWAAPQSYYGVEDPFGLLPNLPCYWLLLALPLFWLRRHPARWMTGRCLLLLGALGLPVFGFTLVFVSATNRYMVDFLPSFVLAASIGLLAVASRPLGGVGRVVRACVLSGLVLYSAAFGAMAAFQHNGLFRHHQPAAFDRIGSWFNLPAAAWEHVSHEEFGPAQLTVQFSRESLGAAEPLLVTGSRARADYVYVFHTGPDAIQLGFMHSGDVDGFLSAPIALDYDIPHVIGIQSGSLYPPGSDPKFWGASTAEVEMKKQRLLLTVDGVPYVDLKKSFHDAAPTEVAFGRNPVSEYAGKTFRGKVLQVARRELPPIQGPVDRGSFTRLGLELPHSPASGRREVLAAAGTSGADDVVFAEYESETALRLGFRHAGAAPWLSAPLTVVPGQVQRLEVGLGSWLGLPGKPADPALAGALLVRFNDRLVWMEQTILHPPAAEAALALGRLPWRGAEEGLADFSGRIVAVLPVPPPAMPPPVGTEFKRYWLAGGEPAYGALRLRLQFPMDQTGKFEPILVSGRSVSEADYVWVQYVDSGRINLGYESTGSGGPRELISLDLAQTHQLELEVPGLFPLPAEAVAAGQSPFEAGAARSRGRMVLDGVVRIDARVKGFPATPAQVTPGENRLSDTFGRRFTGRILLVERGTTAAPAGFFTETGPLELAIRWPATPPAAGTRELLLASGSANRRDRLYVLYEGGGGARLVFEDGEGKVQEGRPFRMAGGPDPHRLALQWGAFGPDGKASASGRVGASLDGMPVLEGSAGFVTAQPLSAWLGGGAPGDAGFSGELRSVRRLPAAGP